MIDIFNIAFYEEEPGVESKTFRLALRYGIWANLSNIGVGLALGFTAAAIPKMKADPTISITKKHGAWIANTLLVAAPLGCLACGIITDRFGRRLVFGLSQIPLVCGWIHLALAARSADIVTGTILIGIGCGMTMGVIFAYLVEISRPNIRGVIGAINNVTLTLGLFIMEIVGHKIAWRTVCYVCAGVSVVLLLINISIPESPYFYLMFHSAEKASIALRTKFRGSELNVRVEIADMSSFKRDHQIKKLWFYERFASLFKESACRPFWIIVPWLILSQLAGVSVVMLCAVELLKTSQSSIDAHTGSIILLFIRLITSVATPVLVYRHGMKRMCLISCLGVSLASFILAIQQSSTETMTIVPLLCLMVYNMFACFGYFTLPLVLMHEMSPLQIRGLLGGTVLSIYFLLMYASSHLYLNYVRKDMGNSFTLAIFGLASFVCIFFLCYYLPETNELTLMEIEEYYMGIRSTLTPRNEIILNQVKLGMGSQPENKILTVYDSSSKKKTIIHKSVDRRELTRKEDDESSTSTRDLNSGRSSTVTFQQ